MIGDFNSDGNVDNNDFVILAGNFGTGTSYSHGDIDFDGTVNISDFVEFKRIFHASQATAAASVPEPSGFVVLTLLGMGILWVLHRQR